MKKITLIGALVLILGGAYFYSSSRSANIVQGSSSTVVANTISAPTNSNIQTDASSKLTLASVRTHASQQDCWVVISGKVYDMTSFISSHPGGEKPIINACGTDGTSTFSRERGHTKAGVTEQLSAFYIGAIEG